jgi:hypothetical protein
VETIKLKFVDFWYGFYPEENFFFKLLSQSYNIELSDAPDFIIYSCYGRQYLKYNCIRIFYASENIRPDFTGCDYAITFDYTDNPKHYRLPLYAIYIDQIANTEHLTRPISREEAKAIWRSKTKFCCMVVSNGQSKKRLEFFEKLSAYKPVDSGGRLLNNIGGPVADKLKFIKDYRFVISFENSSYPGYTTEKIIEPLMADCIPLYWGDPLVNTEFDSHCFLQLTGHKTEEQLISEIMAIDENEERAIDMLCAPKFVGNNIPESIDKNEILRFFLDITDNQKTKKPIAATFNGRLHHLGVMLAYYSKRVAGTLIR